MIVAIVLFSSCDYGTGTREKIYTPEEFLNDARIARTAYSLDSTQLLMQLREELKNHNQSFHSKEYFSGTELIIDTVIYNDTFNRLAVLVLTKNPTHRQLVPDKNHEWYYDATCYLGIKQSDTILLSWIGPNFSNSENPEKLSEIIRDACFTAFARKDTINGGIYKYNLNDKRFWDSPIWKKNFPSLEK